MNGLAERAYYGFVQRSFGPQVWAVVAAREGVAVPDSWLPQDAATLPRLVQATAAVLDRPPGAILEDFGSYLVSHPDVGQIRRLLRYGGDSFLDFLISLEDLADRCRLALPTLDLPQMQLDEVAPGRFALAVFAGPPGFAHVVAGLVRAMADDYGVLALIELGDDAAACACTGEATVMIDLVDTGHQAARAFRLAEAVA